jgi:DNA-binding MarR family transcriptional regulator
MLSARIIRLQSNIATGDGVRREEAIGYWLACTLHRFAGAFSDELRVHCRERGKAYAITPAQYGVLTLLQDDGSQAVGEIAVLLRVDLPTITGIVSRLERMGLVERSHGQADRRVVTVALTIEGREVVASAQSVAVAFNECALRGLSPDERKTLVDQLRHIIANVSPETPVGPGGKSRGRRRPC